MAHELEIRAGKADMVWAGETPWHGLGTKVDPDLTPWQMLKAANLDWKVFRAPLHASYRDKEDTLQVVDVPVRQALIRDRDQSVLSIVSEDWEPVQNYDAFKFFNEFVFAGNMEMHTAGSLHEGRMVWALAKIKDGFSLFGGRDDVESYFLFSNPHEYGKGIDIRLTNIRVVCNNTITLSLGSKSSQVVKLNHRRKFDPEHVKRLLGVARTKTNTYKQVAELLSSKPYTEETLTEYLMEVFPTNAKDKETGETKTSRPARIAESIIETQPGAEYGRGTWWQAYNAVTFSTDHLLGRSNETRLKSAWYGANKERKVFALEKAVEYAQAA